MASLDQVEILTFDCYGTLIDWESGIREVLGEIAARHNLNAPVDDLVREWEAVQFEMISAPSFRRYHGILRDSLRQTFKRRGVAINPKEQDLLAERIGGWQPFPDTKAMLGKLKKHYLIAILSNIDDDILAQTVPKLGIDFDELITSDQLLSYKPRPAHFQRAIKAFEKPPELFLHCAFGAKYDLQPAQNAGMLTAWIKRPGAIQESATQATAEVDGLTGLAQLLQVA